MSEPSITPPLKSSREVIVRAIRTISASPERIWPHLTDSDLFNRYLGLTPLEIRMDRDSDNLNLPTAVMKFFGVTVARQSDPLIEWVAPLWFRRRREFAGSPWHSIVSLQTINEMATGCEVTYEMRFDVRWWFKPFFAVGRHYIKLRISSFLSRVDVLSKAEASETSPAPVSKVSIDRQFCRDRYRDYQIDQQLLETLLDWIASADMRQLQRIRPLQLASELNADAKALLRLLLVGNTEGLFDLNWELVCPSCRGVSVSSSDLKRIKAGFHCDTCRLDLTASFDDALEITFSPTHAIRAVTRSAFCYGYPVQTPHVIVQQRMGPCEEFELESLKPLMVNYWVLPYKHQGIAALGEKTRIVVSEENVRVEEINGGVKRLSLVNQSSLPILFQLQEPLKTAQCLTAAKLTSMQDFRDLLATQILAPDVTLGIRNLTILFTDLKGSTEMYSQIGDAPAFEQVKRHFDLLIKIVRNFDGGVVKTIGDSVMAVFSNPLDAVKAAYEMQRQVTGIGLILKVGINAGPCIAISQNDVLDYFGTTVNLAARVQSLSRGDIVISKTLFEVPGVIEIIVGEGLAHGLESVPIKGFFQDVEVVRVG